MIETLGNLIRYIVILIFLATILEMILPHGEFRRYLRMLVGILLILTILSPIQQIIRLAPGWEVPVFLAAPSGKDELELILRRGEEMRKDSMLEAFSNYRQRLYGIVEALLADQFGAELLALEVSLDETPGSAQFGAIKELSVVMGEKKGAPSAYENSPVEEVKISVVLEEEKTGLSLKERKQINGANNAPSAEETAVARYLARYFLLSEDRVSVSIIP